MRVGILLLTHETGCALPDAWQAVTQYACVKVHHKAGLSYDVPGGDFLRAHGLADDDRIHAAWGDFTLVEAMVLGARCITRDDPEVGVVYFASGQCVPLMLPRLSVRGYGTPANVLSQCSAVLSQCSAVTVQCCHSAVQCSHSACMHPVSLLLPSTRSAYPHVAACPCSSVEGSEFTTAQHAQAQHSMHKHSTACTCTAQHAQAQHSTAQHSYRFPHPVLHKPGLHQQNSVTPPPSPD
jgi:hypothetical protein